MRQAKQQIQNDSEKGVASMFEVVRIFKMENSNHVKAFVDIKACDLVLIKGVRVLSNKEGGLFVSMPSQQAHDNKYYEIVKLLTHEGRQELQDVILAAYNS